MLNAHMYTMSKLDTWHGATNNMTLTATLPTAGVPNTLYMASIFKYTTQMYRETEELKKMASFIDVAMVTVY